MQSLTDRASVEAALTDRTLDPDLRALIGTRVGEIDTEPDLDLSDLVNLHIVQAGDGLGQIEAVLGFPIDRDGNQRWFGEAGFMPLWEWIEDHGRWIETVFVVSDDGFGHVLFVSTAADMDPRLIALCRSDLPTT